MLTGFNAILGLLLLVVLAVGSSQDALFGIVVVSNTAIGIVQEWRAKRSLEFDLPSSTVSLGAAVVAVAAALALDGSWRVTGWHVHRHRPDGEYTPRG